MTAVHNSTSTSPASFGRGFMAMILLALLAAAVATVKPLNYQMSGHAVTSHSDQTWNAYSILNYMEKGKCKPNICERSVDDAIVKWCEIKPGLSIGVLIGKTVDVVITGYAAKTSYWENRCDAR